MRLKHTEFGFDWGAAKVTRTAKHKEAVFIGLETPKGRWTIYVTKTGKVRFINAKTGVELK